MIQFNRAFAMPNRNTFSLPPVAALLRRWLPATGVIVDPFARNSKVGNITNDLNPETTAQFHMLAEEFVTLQTVTADAVLFDPPYSPRQISEVYQAIGRTCGIADTQNARLYKRVKDGLDRMLKPGGIAVCCGWNSLGFGKLRGYEMIEILMVTHGGAHNDTIVTVERKIGKAANEVAEVTPEPVTKGEMVHV
jgi:hypothetical protein